MWGKVFCAKLSCTRHVKGTIISHPNFMVDVYRQLCGFVPKRCNFRKKKEHNTIRIATKITIRGLGLVCPKENLSRAIIQYQKPI